MIAIIRQYFRGCQAIIGSALNKVLAIVNKGVL
jgi:hypothetical protein